MKIGIDSRQISHRKRHGLRTYVENLTQALSGLDQSNEYVLYLDAKDPFQLDHLGSNFTIKILPWHIRYLSTLINDHFLLPLQAKKDKLDIMHYPAGPVNRVRSKNTLTTIHDAIPLFSRKRHLFKMGLVNYLLNMYNAKLITHAKKRQAILITVSERSKKDLIFQAGIADEQVKVIHQGVSENFHRIEASDELEFIKKKYDLGDRFILGFNHKNGKRIIRAYELLPKSIQDEYKIGLITLRRDSRKTSARLPFEDRSGDRIIIIPPVSNRELVLLYNSASLFVFPSFYEGFGFPVLEAMKCGCPVICSNRGSLPEIAGEAALYLEELDDISACTRELAQKMKKMLTDSEFRLRLVQEGTRQAGLFKWEKTAQKTLEVYIQKFRAENSGAGVEDKRRE
jgi:glycosyltransferase involved in cell wall biosynthesis